MSVLLDLFLYIVQQGGVLVGAGAAMLGLLWYLRTIHNAAPRHEHVRAARMLEGIGLLLMALSGAAISMLHVGTGELFIVLSPAFLFKWLLIALVILCAVLRARPVAAGFLAQAAIEGCSGGNWLALLLVNFVAPITTWSLLLSLWAAWALFFGLLWTGCILLLHHEHVVYMLPAALKKAVPAPEPPKEFFPSDSNKNGELV